MISDHFKCVFVHVPKTGGQSVELFFLRLLGLDWDSRGSLLLRPNADPERGPERLAHLYAREYTQLGYLDSGKFADYFKFAFVRNPWSRLVSEYKYRSYGSKYSFRDFVTTGLPEADEYSDAYRHIVPQAAYLYDEEGSLLVDFIGRFESLQQDFDEVCDALNIDGSILPHRNASNNQSGRQQRFSLLKRFLGTAGAQGRGGSKRKHYTDYYDDYTRQLVAELYKPDIELFGYDFA